MDAYVREESGLLCDPAGLSRLWRPPSGSLVKGVACRSVVSERCVACLAVQGLRMSGSSSACDAREGSLFALGCCAIVVSRSGVVALVDGVACSYYRAVTGGS